MEKKSFVVICLYINFFLWIGCVNKNSLKVYSLEGSNSNMYICDSFYMMSSSFSLGKPIISYGKIKNINGKQMLIPDNDTLFIDLFKVETELDSSNKSDIFSIGKNIIYSKTRLQSDEGALSLIINKSDTIKDFNSLIAQKYYSHLRLNPDSIISKIEYSYSEKIQNIEFNLSFNGKKCFSQFHEFESTKYYKKILLQDSFFPVVELWRNTTDSILVKIKKKRIRKYSTSKDIWHKYNYVRELDSCSCSVNSLFNLYKTALY